MVPENTGAALTEHPQIDMHRTGAMKGGPTGVTPLGLTTPVTACFHRGTSVRPNMAETRSTVKVYS